MGSVHEATGRRTAPGTWGPRPLALPTLNAAPSPRPYGIRDVPPGDSLSQRARPFALRVVGRREVARGTVALRLATPDAFGGPLPYQPGQFITLAIELDGTMHFRQYSLCGDGHPDLPWEIAVKRAGRISSHLHEHVRPGDTLLALPPRGAFVLPVRPSPDVPVVFVAGGSGIAPILGMLRALAILPPEQRPQTHLHYAGRDEREMAYLTDLAALAQADDAEPWLRVWIYRSGEGERFTPKALVHRSRSLHAIPDWYVCAPERLQRDALAALRSVGIPEQRLHWEAFGTPERRALALSRPLTRPASRSGRRARVRIAESGRTLDALPGETLLAVLERHGYSPPAGCRAGVCGTCALKVLHGTLANAEDDALSDGERAAGYVVSCTAHPTGEVLVSLGSTASRPQAPLHSNAAPGERSASSGGGTALARLILTLAAVVLLALLLVAAWSLTNSAPTLGAPPHPSRAAPTGAPSTTRNNYQPRTGTGTNDEGVRT